MGIHSLNPLDGDEPCGRRQRQQSREKLQRAHAAVKPRLYQTRVYSHTSCTFVMLSVINKKTLKNVISVNLVTVGRVNGRKGSATIARHRVAVIC